MPNPPENPVLLYIESCPEEHRAKLLALRSLLLSFTEGLEEKISWGMPTYKKGKNLFHFAAHKHHIGIYPGPEAIGFFGERLKPYKNSKGAFQIPWDREVDPQLIRDIFFYNLEKLQS